MNIRAIYGPAAAAALLFFNPIAGQSADWLPLLDSSNTTTQSNDGRAIERYTHGPREEWGYPVEAGSEWNYSPGQETGAAQQNHNSFYVVAPKNPRENAPLCVVMHSANRTAYDYLNFECLSPQVDKNGVPSTNSTAMTNSPNDFYALYLNSTNSEWWGWSQARQNKEKHINAPAPAELRVLDTIEWVVKRYKIDRNRIYLCGVSMGGCGALGIGMPHGDIFAAVRVTVPAGTGYASYRMGGLAPSPAVDSSPSERAAWISRASCVGLPDPPVLVDFSSQQDTWAMTQPALMHAAQGGRLPLVLSWGPFGHATFGNEIEKHPNCAVALAFPWLEIRKNEAYPVFTHASSDQQSPWLNAPAEFDNSGQINAYFRWKTQEDTPSKFSIQLWIDHPTVKNAPTGMPDTATTDVTFRRLQQFKVERGRRYVWQLSRNGHCIGEGKMESDASNLLTLPRVPLSTSPSELSVKPDRE